MPNQFLHPKGLMPDVKFGFTHVAVSTGRKTIEVAGQVAWDADMKLVGGNDLGKQMEQSFRCIETALKAAGATKGDITRMRVYIANYEAEEAPIVGEVTNRFFAPGEPPPSTLIGVQSLALPEFRCEIEATAVIN
jgi:enamine deaminase RidA (YjgF/YER057c/UK114 family)